MTDFSIVVQVGDVLREVNLIQASAEDATDLMKDVLLLMIRSTQKTFEAEGRPTHWDAHKDSTERARFARAMKGASARKLGSLATLGSFNILRVTGLLAHSVGFGAGGAFEAEQGFGESDKFTAVLGTSQPGWQNQFPDSRGWRDAREYLLFQAEDEKDASAMALDWLMRRGPYAQA